MQLFKRPLDGVRSQDFVDHCADKIGLQILKRYGRGIKGLVLLRKACIHLLQAVFIVLNGSYCYDSETLTILVFTHYNYIA